MKKRKYLMYVLLIIKKRNLLEKIFSNESREFRLLTFPRNQKTYQINIPHQCEFEVFDDECFRCIECGKHCISPLI